MQKTWLSRIAQGDIACMAAPLDGELKHHSLPQFDGHRLTGSDVRSATDNLSGSVVTNIYRTDTEPISVRVLLS
jgi:hypothetical protein